LTWFGHQSRFDLGMPEARGGAAGGAATLTGFPDRVAPALRFTGTTAFAVPAFAPGLAFGLAVTLGLGRVAAFIRVPDLVPAFGFGVAFALGLAVAFAFGLTVAFAFGLALTPVLTAACVLALVLLFGVGVAFAPVLFVLFFVLTAASLRRSVLYVVQSWNLSKRRRKKETHDRLLRPRMTTWYSRTSYSCRTSSPETESASHGTS